MLSAAALGSWPLWLGFLTFVGVLAVPLANYATANLRASVNLRSLRQTQVTAESAVNAAINNVHRTAISGGPGSSLTCFTASGLNGITASVTCTKTALNGVTDDDDSFRACPASGPCTDATAVLLATAHYDRVAGTVQVTSWSVRK